MVLTPDAGKLNSPLLNSIPAPKIILKAPRPQAVTAIGMMRRRVGHKKKSETLGKLASFLTQRPTPPLRAPQTANAFGSSSAFDDVFDPRAVQPKLELNLENLQALRQSMTQQSNQLHAARRQCHIRSAMVYNQQIKIHELMLENSGQAADIASLAHSEERALRLGGAERSGPLG